MLEYKKEIKIKYTKAIGYCYFCDLTHPLNTKTGWIYYHRHVASLKIGRWLTFDEIVHHIDGNVFNNNPNNLQITTTAEHGLIHKPPPPRKNKTCSSCGKVLTSNNYKSTFCSIFCQHEKQKKFDISKEELIKLVWEKPSTIIAKQFGVSSKAIEKRCKRFGIEKPPRGYWRKIETNKL